VNHLPVLKRPDDRAAVNLGHTSTFPSEIIMNCIRFVGLALVPVAWLVGCSGSGSPVAVQTGGGAALGGSVASGGSVAVGGSPAGGSSTSGGGPQTGGTTSAGGQSNPGGTVATGGSVSTGGKLGTGGGAAGGRTSTGGSSASGGTSVIAGGTKATGGAAGSGGITSTGGAPATGGAAGTCTGSCSNAAAGACASPQVRISQVNAGSAISFGTDETSVMPLAIAAIPGGGSRVAWMTGYATNASSKKSLLHVAQLDCDDKLVGTPFTMEAYDFQDIAADGNGGVAVITRDAQGGGTLNCGDTANLCGTPPNPADACYDTYMVRYDCAGAEQWATKLTSSSATNPPYTFGSGYNYMVWWYQHQGRIAFDGTNYATYFCDAIVVQNMTCTNNSTGTTGGIDIHEGDRMKVVGPTGSLLTGHDSFDLGCSHSGFTRIVWDQTAGHFIMVCKTDNSNRIAQPNPYKTVYPVNLTDSYVGDIVIAQGGGYWVTVSNNGAVHLLHFNNGAQADQDKTLATANYPHLVAYGSDKMVALWSSTATGNMTAQVFDTSGNQVSSTFTVSVPGHPYQSFKSFPDGSAAFASVGSSTSTIQIARILPCQ
jgi:hypothetical protein